MRINNAISCIIIIRIGIIAIIIVTTILNSKIREEISVRGRITSLNFKNTKFNQVFQKIKCINIFFTYAVKKQREFNALKFEKQRKGRSNFWKSEFSVVKKKFSSHLCF